MHFLKQSIYRQNLLMTPIKKWWWKSGILMLSEPEVELIFTIAPTENSFDVKYLENGKRCNVGRYAHQIKTNCKYYKMFK